MKNILYILFLIPAISFAQSGFVNKALILNGSPGSSGQTPVSAGANAAPVWTTPSAATVITDRITVSSAEILNLNSSPKQLIAAPGSGNIIQLLGITAKYIHVTAGYSVSTGIAGTFNGQGYWTIAGFLNTGADRYSMTGGITNQDYTGTPQSSTSSFVNQPFMLTSTGGNPTLGDGTLIISVTYKIIPL